MTSLAEKRRALISQSKYKKICLAEHQEKLSFFRQLMYITKNIKGLDGYRKNKKNCKISLLYSF